MQPVYGNVDLFLSPLPIYSCKVCITTLQDQNAGRLVHGKHKMETSKTKMLRRWVRAPPLPVNLLDFEVCCYTYLAEIDSVVSNFQIMKLKH